MDWLVLTKVGGILGPFAVVLGVIMDWLFRLTSIFGIENIGLCIILFTFVVKLLMFPLTLKQQKSSKLMSIMQPEITAIQAKYKGKTDQDSMMKQNVEIQAVYEKYGTSMTGGCLQLIIQLPILFALYQVIYHIPAYVSSVKDVFQTVVAAITSLGVDHVAMLNQFATDNKVVMSMVGDMTTDNGLIDFLYKLDPTQWKALEGLFPSISDTIATGAEEIAHMNSFLGINLASTPYSMMFTADGFQFSIAAIMIPVLAGLTQYISTRLVSGKQSNQASTENNPMAQSMKTMNVVMPLMSVFFCFTLPSGIGIYWIAQSVFTILQQWIINRHLSSIDIDEMVKKNVEKANAKRAKKGLPPQKISNNATVSLKQIQAEEERKEKELEAKKARTAEQVKESTEYYNKDPKPGSLAAKAAMVKKYNEKHNK